MMFENNARKLVNSLALASLFALVSPAAHAVTTLRQVQVSGGAQVDLLFDQKVSKSQYKTEFFNDTIQVTFSESSVYPAKISSVSGNSLAKVFTYQYAPKVVRCRLTVKGKAEDYKDRLSIFPSGANGKTLTLKIADSSSVHAGKSATTGRAEGSSASVASSAASSTAIASSAASESNDKALLERVMREKAPTKADRAEKDTITTSAAASTGNQPISSGKKDNKGIDASTTSSILFKLMGVLILFGLGAVFMRKFILGLNGNGRNLRTTRAPITAAAGVASPNVITGALTRFLRSNFGGATKPIEVLATHYLGPKKNIAVVRVSGRVLILGVTQDSVNLISEMTQGEYYAQQMAESQGAQDLDQELTGDAEIDEEMRRIGPVTRPKKQTFAGPNAASSAGNAIFANILGQMGSQMGGGTPSANTAASYDSAPRVSSTPNSGNATGAATSAHSKIGGTGIKAQIRSKLEGLKPL